jgi:hypothetical protein
MGTLELTHRDRNTVSARTTLAWLVPLAVAAAAVAAQLRDEANSDVSWLLTAAQRLADGRPDYFEFNPPGATFTYLPSIWLARLSGLSPEAACDFMVAAVAALSLGLATLALGPRFTARHNAPLLATIAAVIFLVLPAFAFGEREHLGAMLLLPWIAVVAARLEGSTPPVWLRACAGIAGGLCIVIKPHFALGVGVLAVIALWHQRAWRSVFCAENIAAAAVLVVYGAVLWLAFPNYLGETAPMMAAAGRRSSCSPLPPADFGDSTPFPGSCWRCRP